MLDLSTEDDNLVVIGLTKSSLAADSASRVTDGSYSDSLT